MNSENAELRSLDSCAKGWRGHIHALRPGNTLSLSWEEMERRLLEMGFVEGMLIEILHEGPVKRDPIAVRLGDMTVALRRSDASAVLVEVAG